MAGVSAGGGSEVVEEHVETCWEMD